MNDGEWVPMDVKYFFLETNKKKPNLRDELLKENEEAYQRWFDRWFRHRHFTDEFKNAAMQGYTGTIIYNPDLNNGRLTDDEKYLYHRISDERFVPLMREKFPDLTIKAKKWKKKHTQWITNIPYTKKYFQVSVSWAKAKSGDTDD
ncbi:hypothetical protein JCM14202_3066 [Agrilactobacillus composti DSM 18527 = JCM 14202]|nr:hypothetical protein JCM14202_3066 [Agrilactobacillus composti DSM 18527 = JCM 14202]